jgi:prepilin-type N-terminal cleavage/methylation domain-containing protein
MKSARSATPTRKGFTLIELSVVIFILIALLSMGFGMSRAIDTWKKGKEASETLRSVYTAQRLYLADHPTSAVSTLTHSMVAPYIPNGNGNTVPTAVSLTNGTLYARVNVSPPVWTTTSGGTSGTAYDPSGSSTDSLWDVGQ